MKYGLANASELKHQNFNKNLHRSPNCHWPKV